MKRFFAENSDIVIFLGGVTVSALTVLVISPKEPTKNPESTLLGGYSYAAGLGPEVNPYTPGTRDSVLFLEGWISEKNSDVK